jgi:RNA polymerase primary sigma factor
LSIEEKYDEIKALIALGKEKGYLLYEEINDLLPADVTSAEELDDLFSAFGAAGIEIVDSEKTYRDEKVGPEEVEGGSSELDLTPGALDKTNDPVRMYLREMGTVPLLTREGEVAIAKRIERGKLTVIKLISRTSKVTQEVVEMGDQLKRGERTIRELVVFNEEEITDEKLERRRRCAARATRSWTSVRRLSPASACASSASTRSSSPVRSRISPAIEWRSGNRAVACLRS